MRGEQQVEHILGERVEGRRHDPATERATCQSKPAEEQAIEGVAAGVALAAQAVREAALPGVEEALVRAYASLHGEDPGCRARLALLEALDHLEATDDAPFVHAARYVQLEKAWGDDEPIGRVTVHRVAEERRRGDVCALLAATGYEVSVGVEDRALHPLLGISTLLARRVALGFARCGCFGGTSARPSASGPRSPCHRISSRRTRSCPRPA